MKNIKRNGHLEGVNSVIFSFDDKVMISLEKNTIKVWDVLRGVELRTLLLTDEMVDVELDLVSEAVIRWLLSQDQIVH